MFQLLNTFVQWFLISVAFASLSEVDISLIIGMCSLLYGYYVNMAGTSSEMTRRQSRRVISRERSGGGNI